MKVYDEFLEEGLNNFGGDFEKYIFYTPNFFRLLCKLHDEKIDSDNKKAIDTSLAYFVLPNDLISEEIYGPAGYIDDIFVCALVLKQIQAKYGTKILGKNWDSEEDIEVVLEECYKKSKKEIEKQGLLEKIFEITGLRDIDE